MPQYRFKARDNSGKFQTGYLEAASVNEAAVHLRERNYIIIDIKENSVGRSYGTMLRTLFTRKTSRKDLGILCRQLGVMLDAGVPLMSGLAVLKEQVDSAALKHSLEDVYKSVETGNGLAESLEKHPKIFPNILVKMIESGETGGVLDNVLFRMADYFEWEHGIREKVKSSLVYPSVVMGVALLAIIFLITFVLPIFADVLYQLGVELPLLTRIILGFSETARNFWYAVVSVMILMLYLTYRYLNTERGRERRDRYILKVPVVGDLIRKTMISRFCQTLATLLQGGVPILEALEVVKKTAGNKVVEDSINNAAESIRDGEGMTQPLKDSGIFPPMVTEMIAIGEESGTVDTMLEKVGHFYDNEVEDTANRLSTLIEPILIVFLGVVVGLILLSVLLPIFKVMGSIQ